MRKAKLLLVCFAVLAVETFLGKRHDFDDIKRGRRNRNIIKTEISTDSQVNDAGETNARRLQLLKKACKHLGYTNDNYTTDIRAHMSPNYKLLYCRVNKCASTMTLEVIKRIFSCDTECLVKMAALVKSNINADEIMKDAFSFMIVREPYGRLFSTYCNIFYFPKEDWLNRGIKIIKLTRSNISFDSLSFGHDLTFFELIKYTVESYENGSRLDDHVRPMHHKSCNPCVFNFDYIAHLETLQSDFEYILKTMQLKNIIANYPKDIVKSLREWTLFGPIKHLFRTILLVKQSSVSLYNIFLRAWHYYQIIGEVSKTIPLPYNEDDINNVDKEGFLRTLKIAIESSKNQGNDLSKQRYEAMLQAYSTVPLEYMERLRKVVANDCFLFGYEERPDYLFDRGRFLLNKENAFNYFKGL